MKKKIRRLRLDRETLRNLTPEHLDQAAGGLTPIDTMSWTPSCPDFSIETRPGSVCNSCAHAPFCQ